MAHVALTFLFEGHAGYISSYDSDVNCDYTVSERRTLTQRVNCRPDQRVVKGQTGSRALSHRKIKKDKANYTK